MLCIGTANASALTSPGVTFRRCLRLLLHLHILLLLPLIHHHLLLLLLLRRRRCRFSLGRTGLLPCRRNATSLLSEKRAVQYLSEKRASLPRKNCIFSEFRYFPAIAAISAIS